MYRTCPETDLHAVPLGSQPATGEVVNRLRYHVGQTRHHCFIDGHAPESWRLYINGVCAYRVQPVCLSALRCMWPLPGLCGCTCSALPSTSPGKQTGVFLHSARPFLPCPHVPHVPYIPTFLKPIAGAPHWSLWKWSSPVLLRTG